MRKPVRLKSHPTIQHPLEGSNPRPLALNNINMGEREKSACLIGNPTGLDSHFFLFYGRLYYKQTTNTNHNQKSQWKSRSDNTVNNPTANATMPHYYNNYYPPIQITLINLTLQQTSPNIHYRQGNCGFPVF